MCDTLLQAAATAESSLLSVPPGTPESMRERLDFRPTLQGKEVRMHDILLPSMLQEDDAWC